MTETIAIFYPSRLADESQTPLTETDDRGASHV